MRLPDAISHGKHVSPEQGLCVMETVAYIAGEPHTDRPACACPVITALAIAINDALPDDATRTRLLAPFVHKIVDTRLTTDVQQRRGFMLADFYYRILLPHVLHTRYLVTYGFVSLLQSHAPITNVASALAVAQVYATHHVQFTSWFARDVVRDAETGSNIFPGYVAVGVRVSLKPRNIPAVLDDALRCLDAMCAI